MAEERRRKDRCQERLEQLNLPQAPKHFPEPNNPGNNGVDYLIQTNIFGLEIFKKLDVFQYVVHIKTDLRNNQEIVFTKKLKNDFTVLDRHEKCCEIFSNATRQFPHFFNVDDNSLIYDGQSILFSTSDLFSEMSDWDEKRKYFEIKPSDLTHPDLSNLPSPIIISIEAITDEKCAEKTFKQLLELALYQNSGVNLSKAICFEKKKLFFVRPIDDGYITNDCVEVGDGKYMIPGIHKKVQEIEGPGGRGNTNPAVIIDGLKVAFHKEQPVMEKISEILRAHSPANGLLTQLEREKCAPVIKGLDCYSTYTGRIRHHKIEGICDLGASRARFQMENGKIVTVLKYFEQKYKIKLAYPEANILICRDRGNKNFYPIELMTITKNQRVTFGQQTGYQSQRTTKESAVLPEHRQRLIMTGKRAASIDSSNLILARLGVLVSMEPIVTSARKLDHSQINFYDKSTMPHAGKFRFSGFLRPANQPKVWAMYAVTTRGNDSKFTQYVFDSFLASFADECQSKGIRMVEPTEVKWIKEEEVDSHLIRAAENSCEYVMVLTDDSLAHLHHKYKLIERTYQMIIQNIKTSTACRIVLQRQKLTMDNIINKTNLKLGGTNYTIPNSRLNGALVIGVGFSKPGQHFSGLQNPLVVGFSFNATAEQEFSGDFVLSEPGQDTILSIEEIVSQCLQQFKNSRNDRLPKKVLVYRSGSCSGSQGSIISNEIPLARVAINRVSDEIKLIYIMVSKDHTYRFFKRDGINTLSVGSSNDGRSARVRVEDLNIPPGIVLDSVVTQPGCKQFFLNSHATLQGTAKTPLYTVLADDCNAKMDSLEEITYNLCHTHQIVGMTTSVPTPLYVANEYAKRGGNLFVEHCKKAGIQKSLDEVTDEISYKNAGGMIGRRINA